MMFSFFPSSVLWYLERRKLMEDGSLIMAILSHDFFFSFFSSLFMYLGRAG